MSTRFEYVGEEFKTRGDYGQVVDIVYKVSWGVAPEDQDNENAQPSWYEDENGHTWAAWDSDFGWIAPLSLSEGEVGRPLDK